MLRPAAWWPRRRHRSPKTGGVAQLGLPLLLGPRCDVHAVCPDDVWLHDEALAWRDWLLRAVAG